MKKILCFGDSNTWGYIPGTGERFNEGVRWTSILQGYLEDMDVQVLEEGLCGRTSMFDDRIRPNRNGLDALPEILQNSGDLDAVILMLGTNDCKEYLHNTAEEIAQGVDKCLDQILNKVSSKNVILVSPILLGERVWEKEFDPEFSQESVRVSKKLKEEYRKVAKRRNVHFIAASDYVAASRVDQEHMDAAGHRTLAGILYGKLIAMSLQRENLSA